MDVDDVEDLPRPESDGLPLVRGQGMTLLVFTIAKTFLHDRSSLSEGYRVVSFPGLGVALMGVSFACQLDWLRLRQPQAVFTHATVNTP